MKPLKRDYYSMEIEELDKAIAEMRAWFWKFPKHEQSDRVMLALSVACSAKEIYEDRKNDPWIQELVDVFSYRPES